MLKGLYVITDEKLTPYNRVLEQVKKALKGGAKVVQLRDKHSSKEDLKQIALSLKELCQEFEAYFIINDNIELAKEIESDGVHIGELDSDFSEVRNYLGRDKLIGVSCYGDIERALRMQELGADYVAFGSFFKSKTKPKSNVVDIEILKEAREKLSIPICVIGGITIERAKEFIPYGVDLISVIHDIWSSEDIELRAREYQELFK